MVDPGGLRRTTRIRQETLGGTERAMALLPGQSEYYARLAWLVSGDDPPKAEAALRRAVALNPWDARSWIELGLRAEARENDAAAQRCMLRAAEMDRQFLPRWRLANYYFRHDDEAMFWHWTREAAAMVYGDANPVFRLCARVREDGKLIDRLEIQNPDVRAAYLPICWPGSDGSVGPPVHRLLEENGKLTSPCY